MAKVEVWSEGVPVAASGGRTRQGLHGPRFEAGMQLRLAGYLGGAAAVLSVGLGWMLWRAYRETRQVLEMADPGARAALAASLAHEDRLRTIAVSTGLLLVLALLVGAPVPVMRRIASRACAIGRTCRPLAEGDLTEPPPLRPSDLLCELGDEVATPVKVLRGREARERDVLAAAARVLRNPLAAAPTRRQLASHLESLATAKEERLRS